MTNVDEQQIRSIAFGLYRTDVYFGCGISLLQGPRKPVLTTGDRELIIRQILDDAI